MYANPKASIIPGSRITASCSVPSWNSWRRSSRLTTSLAWSSARLALSLANPRDIWYAAYKPRTTSASTTTWLRLAMRSLALRTRRLVAPTAVTDWGAGGMGILDPIPSYYQKGAVRYRLKRSECVSVGSVRTFALVQQLSPGAWAGDATPSSPGLSMIGAGRARGVGSLQPSER